MRTGQAMTEGERCRPVPIDLRFAVASDSLDLMAVAGVTGGETVRQYSALSKHNRHGKSVGYNSGYKKEGAPFRLTCPRCLEAIFG